jgi:predicted ATP-grasp superfamily ATP-dependent carboligase
MKTPVLLVATATQWFGTPRMARGLAEAGFEVLLLTPQHSLAEMSRFVSRVVHLPDNATPLQWVHAFASIVRVASPRLALPCDDMAFRLMQQLALTPPDNLQPAVQLQCATLIADSLGDPAYYRMSVDKMQIGAAAEALGVRVPAYLVSADPGTAEHFAQSHGYPVVIKRSHSSAGKGVEICADRDALRREFAAMLRPDALSLGDASDGKLLIQAYIPGKVHYFNGVAWQGTLLAGNAAEQLAATPKGPASAVRYYRSPELRDFAARLARGFRMTGLFVPEFVVHEASGEPYLLEVNRRMTLGTHRGSRINVDLCAALYAAAHGLASTSRADLDPGEEHFAVAFPLEWMRDPASRYLREYPVDVPWDEPELVDALVALAVLGFKNAR